MQEKEMLNLRYLINYNKCNYSCPYCIVESTRSGSGLPGFSEDETRTIAENIMKMDRLINLRISVFGEFFLSGFLVDIAREFSFADNIASLNLITNGSLPATQYKTILESIKTDKVAMVASFHPTEIKDVVAWLKTAFMLHQEVDFAVAIVGYPPLLESLPRFVHLLQEQGIHTFIQGYVGVIDGRTYPRDYTDAEKRILRDASSSRHDYEFFVEAARPGLCNAGHTSIYVNYDGLVTPCGIGRRTEKLGDMLKSPAIALHDGPRPCVKNNCFCDTENINTESFRQHYQHTGLNQHKFVYRFADLARDRPGYDEWAIRYP